MSKKNQAIWMFIALLNILVFEISGIFNVAPAGVSRGEAYICGAVWTAILIAIAVMDRKREQ